MEHKCILRNKYKIFGFLFACLSNMSVTEKELEQAIHCLIADCSDMELIETYIDILEYDGTRLDLMDKFRSINHSKWLSPLTKSQDDALIGIAYKRGVLQYEHTPELEANAKRALEKHPEVTKLFRDVFPFIDF